MIVSLLKRAKHKLVSLLLSSGSQVECNVCGWQGLRFVSDSWHPHTICPKCGSQVRHRLLLSACHAEEESTGKPLVRNADVMHFAPERVLSDLLSSGARKYVTADFVREDVDLRLDMCDMDSVSSQSLDLVIACDVLEHVPDDVRAMSELLRILRPGGCAILTVPQKFGLSTTYEDRSIVTEAGRLEAFGQEDHLRIYGDDFPAVLERNGFTVTTYDETDFSPETVRRNVLFPPILSPHPLATNYRKVFFARRPS